MAEKNPSQKDLVSRFTRVHDGALGWLVAEHANTFGPLVVVCPDSSSAESLLKDIRLFSPSSNVVLFPEWDTLPFEGISPSLDVTAARFGALRSLSTQSHKVTTICVTYPLALLSRLTPRHTFEEHSFSLKVSDEYSIPDLLERFNRLGYRKASLVAQLGDLAGRGSIIDIFPPNFTSPIRIEFSDQKVSSIRSFSIGDQRTEYELSTEDLLDFFPIREVLHPTLAQGGIEIHKLVRRLKERGKKLETPPREIVRYSKCFEDKTTLPGLEVLLPFAYEELSSFFDYLPDEAVVVSVDPMDLERNIDKFHERIEERHQRKARSHHLIPERAELFLEPKTLIERIRNFKRLEVDALEYEVGQTKESNTEKVNYRSYSNAEVRNVIHAQGYERSLAPTIEKWRRDDYSLAFVISSPFRSKRLKDLLLSTGMDVKNIPELTDTKELATRLKRNGISIFQGELSAGFRLERERIGFIAETDLFPKRSTRQGVKREEASLRKLLGALSLLEDGDFIVHEDYGIGRYIGLEHRKIEEIESDFLVFEYADSKLYLPIQQIGKIQRYQVTNDNPPKLDRLGSARWAKVKAKAQEAIVELAGDLVNLYAARSHQVGWRFAPYCAEDEEFADEFPFDETPDQLNAIHDVFKDMAAARPMDRLICGDVGFGKTEVAIRAAHKCLQHRRQVAVLVPTTILVEQHTESFRQRFSHTDFVIEPVSRFHAGKEGKDTLSRLKSGEVDIVIGTHKLLSRNVEFKDLGLLIIDEEHRFGVQQKERLKQLKRSIDVLSLTATPIPRSLHMSLLNIRDISVMSTPPTDRRVIRSYLAPRNEGVIRDAILRELDRKGQVFFLHNRVQSIFTVMETLREIVPEAVFEAGHGQMSEKELEPIMNRFIRGETDVLVATTIIESGIDIPNANTIIIDRADTLGLAQLYQLRGRVGRSTRQAYSYFLVPNLKKLTTDARKRLQVLQSLDDLGLGFNLALRDLEIRGAGNLLGKQQHGHVISIGYDLYMKILAEAMQNIKGESDALPSVDPEVKIAVSAFIPDEYIPDISERLVLYQRLAILSQNEEVDDLAEEIRDRFGNTPLVVDNLIETMRIRALLRRAGATHLEALPDRVRLNFSSSAPILVERIIKLVHESSGMYRFTQAQALTVLLDFNPLENIPRLYRQLERLLGEVCDGGSWGGVSVGGDFV